MLIRSVLTAGTQWRGVWALGIERSMRQAHTPHGGILSAIGMLESCVVACSHHAARHANAADAAWKVVARATWRWNRAFVLIIWKPAPAIQVFTARIGWKIHSQSFSLHELCLNYIRFG